MDKEKPDIAQPAAADLDPGEKMPGELQVYMIAMMASNLSPRFTGTAAVEEAMKLLSEARSRFKI